MLPFQSSELATTNFEGSSTASLSEQHFLPASIGLHLLPGALTAIVFFTVAPFVQRSHLPPFIALCAANLTILPLFIFGILYYQGYKRNGRLTLEGVVLYRQNISWRDYLTFVPIVFFACPLLILSLSSVTNAIHDTLFSWWPAMYNLAADLSAYSRSTLTFAYLLNFVAVSLAAPIMEEIYFRGYLLPRLSRFGLWAIPINSILFALFHMWTPSWAVARAVGLMPLIFVTQKKQNIYIGMIAHVLVNFLDVLAGIIFILKHF